MREIKFRGKSKKTNKWLYGDLLRNEQGAFAVVPPFKMNMANECNLYEVDEETIGQFTGLTDKNGKRFMRATSCYNKAITERKYLWLLSLNVARLLSVITREVQLSADLCC